MSAPAKTSDRAIRSVARKLLERDGIDRLSMHSVADEVGIRSPSLYKHFANRADLLRYVIEDALEDLRRAVDKAARPGSAYQNLERMAAAYRSFAKKNPGAYQLVFAAQVPNDDADRRARLASVETLLRILTDAVGQDKALPSARTLVAFLHGFVLMETTGLFRLGGDVDQAFRFGLKMILDSLLKE